MGPLRWITRLAILVLFLVLTACGTPNAQPAGLTAIPSLAPAGTVTLVPAIQGGGVSSEVIGGADPAIGAAIYMKNCTPCHGVEGQGIDGPPLRNSPYIQNADDQSIFDTIANGRPSTEMPAWLEANGGSLVSLDISSVVAYLHTLQGVASVPPGSPPPTEASPTPLPPNAPTPEPAKPSEPGGPGSAASMTGNAANGQADFGLYCAACHGPEGIQGIPNPGSDDGSVPPLNPLDPTLVNSDPAIFAVNLDLFIEHGSVPEGEDPRLMMPPFGDSQMLSDQQIADLIVYIMGLNGVKSSQ